MSAKQRLIGKVALSALFAGLIVVGWLYWLVTTYSPAAVACWGGVAAFGWLTHGAWHDYTRERPQRGGFSDG